MDSIPPEPSSGRSENPDPAGRTPEKGIESTARLRPPKWRFCGRWMGSWEVGRPAVLLVCGSLVYYHCAYRHSSLLSLVADVFIVLLCSLAILGMLFRQMSISVPVDPLEWQISQETANAFAACMANTVGAAESVLRVAATGHDKRLFLKVVFILYLLSALGRLTSGPTVAYIGLCLLCLYIFTHNSPLMHRLDLRRRESTDGAPD